MLSPLKLTPSMTTEVMIDVINQNFRQLEGEARRKVITDENGVDRIVIGRQEDGTYAIKVSGEGKDVNRATPDELVMSSDWDLWKIINHGQIYADGTDVARSGTVSITSSNIAYVNDIMIKIDDIYGNTADIHTSGYAGQLQAFVRYVSTRKDVANTRMMYVNGSNQVMRHDCYFVHPGGWITIRRMFRWLSGSTSLTPRNYMGFHAYWAIANPSRIFVGGQGGGGTPTGQNVFWDYTIYNASSEPYPDRINDITGTTMIQPGEFGGTKSETYVLPDTAAGYLFGEESVFLVATAMS